MGHWGEVWPEDFPLLDCHSRRPLTADPMVIHLAFAVSRLGLAEEEGTAHTHGGLCGTRRSSWQEVRRGTMQGILVRSGLSCSKKVLSRALVFRKQGHCTEEGRVGQS